MHLILYPLTFAGNEEKQIAIRKSVKLAKMIQNQDQESFALAGILAFTDKVISEETRNEIKEVLSMTQVGKMLFDEGRQEGAIEQARKTALNMFARGDLAEEIAAMLGFPVETIKRWKEERN